MALDIHENNKTGLDSSLTVTFPTNTFIINMRITLNLTHHCAEELIINVMAPSTKRLNLADSKEYCNLDPGGMLKTSWSSTSTTPINNGTSPCTGTFKAEAILFPGSADADRNAVVSNVQQWNLLYDQTIGNWTLKL